MKGLWITEHGRCLAVSYECTPWQLQRVVCLICGNLDCFPLGWKEVSFCKEELDLLFALSYNGICDLQLSALNDMSYHFQFKCVYVVFSIWCSRILICVLYCACCLFFPLWGSSSVGPARCTSLFVLRSMLQRTVHWSMVGSSSRSPLIDIDILPDQSRHK